MDCEKSEQNANVNMMECYRHELKKASDGAHESRIQRQLSQSGIPARGRDSSVTLAEKSFNSLYEGEESLNSQVSAVKCRWWSSGTP